jgi:uncharacterized protein (DUF342 family)
VRKGDLLAERTPPTEGWNGYDVLGNVLPAQPGRDRKLLSAGKVRISEDGLRCYADTDGVVTLSAEGKIGVFQVFQIPGDVDYATGNLTMDGTLEIKGWIRSGFVVRASGDILVGEGIEDATVVSGANLEVTGGIIGKRLRTVRTGGSLAANFMDSALIDAAGDVQVNHSVIRSFVRAKGSVRVQGGRGSLMGGSVVADRGVEVNELGSRGAVKTVVEVGANAEAMVTFARYEKEVDFARRNEKKIKMLLAALNKKSAGRDRAATERALKGKLVKLRRNTKLRQQMLERFRKRVALGMTEGDDRAAGVKVNKTVYRGSKVIVNGYVLEVNEDIPKPGTFVLNTTTWTVEYIS